MYQALYRKWRPQTFDDVVGQPQVTETLRGQIISGRLSHAYIFIGTRGTGKTTCARILAKAVNCDNPVNGNPCGVCPSCRAIADGTALDIVEIDAASNNGVDNIRSLRDEAVFTPSQLKKRVYIIDEVHMLSAGAFNALLKILEEPPEHLMFILATTELQKVPATILSRCQRHSFHRIENKKLAEYVSRIAEKENLSVTSEAALLIAGLAEGGVRDALSLLDQCSACEAIGTEEVYSVTGLAGSTKMLTMFHSIAERDVNTLLTEYNDLWMSGKDPASLLKELCGLARDVLVVKTAPKTCSEIVSGSFDVQSLKKIAKAFTTEELVYMMDAMQGALSAMRDRINPKLTAELCLVSLCENRLSESISALRARVSRLEEAVKNGSAFYRPVSVPVSDYTEECGGRDFSDSKAYSDSEYEPEPECDLRADTDDEMPEPELPFEEEQPEDAFIAKNTPSQKNEVQNREVSWNDICNCVKPMLHMPIKLYSDNPAILTGALSDAVLKLEVQPGFYYQQVNRPDIVNAFSKAASDLCGREIRVTVSEMKSEIRPQRDITELSNIPEIKTI